MNISVSTAFTSKEIYIRVQRHRNSSCSNNFAIRFYKRLLKVVDADFLIQSSQLHFLLLPQSSKIIATTIRLLNKFLI
ncbi:30S ribosomal protein [Dirofilaria immitis]